ncbi:PrtD family type I secretion system ABC transporter [Methylopila capsulata]|uniref:PrtD family type I secretion system ABC transporter n=1 Tax=Methylopila capsulata TaxID=61654 RepID=A0A9W6IWK6_9HYPH|nr:type I secretion system permease/ATPase [Methylopila capsulata]MBM7852395.1 PrtD family type I secretion system ABC transporter [Methylopila capsulata]GLK56604.1 type I secretion protein [Methylopila capsulata]
MTIGGGAFLAVAAASGVINILTLSGAIFMMEVYDRVLPSHSLPTLLGLTGIVLLLYVFLGFFDLVRARILVRVGLRVDEQLGQRVFRTTLRTALRSHSDGDGQQLQRDLDQVRAFLSGSGPTALFDLPWMPIYLAVCFMFHPWLGLTTLGGALLLVCLTFLTEKLTQSASRMALAAGMTRGGVADAGRRNAEVVQALGMSGRLGQIWGDANTRFMTQQRRTSDVSGGFGAVSKVFRMALQSAVLGVGAYLVIDGQATGGIMIASSILTSRALAPVDLAIGNWKGFVAARQGWRRLKEALGGQAGDEDPRMKLPAPRQRLSVEAAGSAPPNTPALLVDEISFFLDAGSGVGVIGPSGSGKSSLARMLVGVWPARRGKVRLDGASLDQWDPEDLGGHIGYLPQDVELFAGTIEQNIARFHASPESGTVISAAQAAGVHDMILRLPDGYKCQIGAGGAALSAGQRQRVALARALYGAPFLVVLDEPNSNLDREGELALTQAILGVRARGGIVVVIAHRSSALAGVDLVLAMKDGRLQSFGPKDEVLSKVLQPAAMPRVSAGPALTIVPVGG